MGQLADAKARLAQAAAEEEQMRVKLGMSQKELKALETRWKEVEREAGEGARNLQAMKAEIEKCQRKIEACGWNAEMEQQRETALQNAKAELRQLTQVSASSHGTLRMVI